MSAPVTWDNLFVPTGKTSNSLGSQAEAGNRTDVQTAKAGRFEYDALKGSGRRKSPRATIVREDVHVRGQRRKQLIASTSDLARNFSIAAWMVRRHLDYVARFNFASTTGDRGLDRDIEAIMEIQSQPLQMDRGGRFGREKFFRLAEKRAVLDGDFGLLRLRSGQTQALESDLIANPPADVLREGDEREWVDGIKIDYAGMPTHYSLHGRAKGGQSKTFGRIVPAQNFILYGCFDRDAANQVRGISPIASAINTFRDVYDNLEYAQLKAKISQLFAVALMRKSSSTSLDTALPTAEKTAVENGEACDEDLDEPRTLDLTKGPTIFDLEEDEDMKVIESATPSTEFQTYMKVAIAIALKALDIPFSFYDEAYTNYSGGRSSWIQYDRSADDRRADQIEMRRRWTLWQYTRWIADDLLVLPSRKSLSDLGFEWVPRGMPWWKPSEEIVGDLKSIAGGLNTPQRVCRQRDTGDIFDNIDDTLQVMKYARDRGNEVLGEPLLLSFEADFPTTIDTSQS